MTQLTRRGFIAGLIATPTIVQAKNIYVPPRRLIRPEPLVAAAQGDLHYDLWSGVIRFFDGDTWQAPRVKFDPTFYRPLTQGD